MSASRKRQTMAKLTRERTVKERRALKQEKKQAAAELRRAKASGAFPDDSTDSGEAVPGIVREEEGAAAGTPDETDADRAKERESEMEETGEELAG